MMTPHQPNLAANYTPITYESSYSVTSPQTARIFADMMPGFDFGLRTPQANAFFQGPPTASLAGVMAASPPANYRSPSGMIVDPAQYGQPPALGPVPAGRASFPTFPSGGSGGPANSSPWPLYRSNSAA